MRNGMAGRLAIAVAVCVALNLALTLQNAWPSIWVRAGAGLSVELLAVLAFIALCLEWRPAMPRWVAWVLSAGLLILIVGRYVAVTANALFGRSINVYFDFPQLPAVLSMNAASRPTPEVVVLALLAIAIPLVLLVLLRFGIGAISASLSDHVIRRPVLALSILGVAAYAAIGPFGMRWMDRAFAYPVSPVYAEQVRFVIDALSGRQAHAFSQKPLPPLKVDGLGGGDVYVIFLESYGEVAYGVPEIAEGVRPRVAVAEQRLRQAGWHIASGYFTSPTFGGASWLAHSSFLTGRLVSNNRDYQLLLSSDQSSLVGDFSRAGYRTVALMPGLKLAWPEGRFYGFDRFYDAKEVGYSGWPYGWWAIPDQFSLARMVEAEAEKSGRKPLFVVFPTIMSHMPFAPVPAYQEDWKSAANAAVYAKVPLRREDGLGRWETARAAYRTAVLYNIDMVQGFLTDVAPDDAVVVVLGDHQPPAVISGAGASRLVPVHVFARDPKRVEKFEAVGFKGGFTPNGGSLGDFEVLHRSFVDALR
jgi:hypothetical protein